MAVNARRSAPQLNRLRVSHDNHIAGFELSAAAYRHRIARVGDKVAQRILQFADIDLARPAIGCQFGDNFDIFRDGAADQLIRSRTMPRLEERRIWRESFDLFELLPLYSARCDSRVVSYDESSVRRPSPGGRP